MTPAIAHRKMKGLKIIEEEDTTQLKLGILLGMEDMWCRVSLVGAISPLFGSLGTLRNL